MRLSPINCNAAPRMHYQFYLVDNVCVCVCVIFTLKFMRFKLSELITSDFLCGVSHKFVSHALAANIIRPAAYK